MQKLRTIRDLLRFINKIKYQLYWNYYLIFSIILITGIIELKNIDKQFYSVSNLSDKKLMRTEKLKFHFHIWGLYT